MNDISKKPYEISVWAEELEDVSLVEGDSELAKENQTNFEKYKAAYEAANPQATETEIEKDIAEYFSRRKLSTSKTDFREKKLAVIGSNTSKSPNRAINPSFTTNINGSHTLTFTMYYRYFDNEKGDYVENPLVKYLCNERKIKLNKDGKWFDLVIKNIQENSENYTFTYTAKDQFIKELSKNGFNLEYDVKLQNNIGKAHELAKSVLEETDWYVKGYDPLVEDKPEQLYEVKLLSNICDEGKLKRFPFDNNGDLELVYDEVAKEYTVNFIEEAIGTGDDFNTPHISDVSSVSDNREVYLLIPYSAYANRKADFQAFYCTRSVKKTEGGYETNSLRELGVTSNITKDVDDDFNILTKKDKNETSIAAFKSYWLTNIVWEERTISGTNETYTVPSFAAPAPNSGDHENLLKLVNYRSRVLTQQQKTLFDPVTQKLVTVYKDSGGHTVYCYEQNEFYSPTLVRNYIVNGKNFVSTDGWQAGGSNTIGFDYYVDGENFVPYLKCHFAGNTYTKNAAIESNRSLINGFSAGDKYVLRVKCSKVSGGKRRYTPQGGYWHKEGDDVYGYTSMSKGKGICGTITPYDLRNGVYTSARSRYFHFAWGHKNVIQTLNYINENNEKEEYSLYKIDETSANNNPLNGRGDEFDFVLPNTAANGDNNTYYKYMVAEAGKSASYNDLLNNPVGFFLYAWGDYETIDELCIENIELFPFKTEDIELSGSDGKKTYHKLILPGAAVDNKNLSRLVYNCYYPNNDYTNENDKWDDSDLLSDENVNVEINSPNSLFGEDDEISAGLSVDKDIFDDFFYDYTDSLGERHTWRNGENKKEDDYSDNGTGQRDSVIKEIMSLIYTGSISIIATSNGVSSYRHIRFYIALLRSFIKAKKIANLDDDKAENYQQIDNIEPNEDTVTWNAKFRKAINVANFFPNVNSIVSTFVKKTQNLDEDDIYYVYKGTEEPTAANDGWTKVLESGYEKIRTISGKESNRFNLLQKICEGFECWAQFDVSHDEKGRISYRQIKDENGIITDVLPDKGVYLRKFIGKENYAGFKYGINLKSIARTLDSDQSITKIIVKDNTNEYGKNGFCTIARASENPFKENYLYNFDHYVRQGLLKYDDIVRDLYDTSQNKYIGYYEKLRKENKDKVAATERYAELVNTIDNIKANYETYNQVYQSAQEQISTILQALKENNKLYNYENSKVAITALNKQKSKLTDEVQNLLIQLVNYDKRAIYYESEANKWKKELETYQKAYDELENAEEMRVKRVADLNKRFYAKYSRFIEEGTWNSDDYFDDNLYYFDALSVLTTSISPKVSYTINVLEISQLEGYEGYKFECGDKTYMEDTEFFGYSANNMPYREEIIVSETIENFDSPENNQLKVQNYKTQFEDLFQRITAQTQSLEFNKNAYGRAASVFTPAGGIEPSVLQESLKDNSLILQNIGSQSVSWDEKGIIIQDGSDPNEICRLVNKGILLTVDGGASWQTAITGRGINANYIYTGQLDAGRVNIVSGSSTPFKWTKDGIFAYYYDAQEDSYDYNKYVRFNDRGIFGIENRQNEVRDLLLKIQDTEWTEGAILLSAQEYVTLYEYSDLEAGGISQSELAKWCTVQRDTNTNEILGYKVNSKAHWELIKGVGLPSADKNEIKFSLNWESFVMKDEQRGGITIKDNTLTVEEKSIITRNEQDIYLDFTQNQIDAINRFLRTKEEGDCFAFSDYYSNYYLVLILRALYQQQNPNSAESLTGYNLEFEHFLQSATKNQDVTSENISKKEIIDTFLSYLGFDQWTIPASTSLWDYTYENGKLTKVSKKNQDKDVFQEIKNDPDWIFATTNAPISTPMIRELIVNLRKMYFNVGADTDVPQKDIDGETTWRPRTLTGNYKTFYNDDEETYLFKNISEIFNRFGIETLYNKNRAFFRDAKTTEYLDPSAEEEEKIRIGKAFEEKVFKEEYTNNYSVNDNQFIARISIIETNSVNRVLLGKIGEVKNTTAYGLKILGQEVTKDDNGKDIITNFTLLDTTSNYLTIGGLRFTKNFVCWNSYNADGDYCFLSSKQQPAFEVAGEKYRLMVRFGDVFGVGVMAQTSNQDNIYGATSGSISSPNGALLDSVFIDKWRFYSGRIWSRVSNANRFNAFQSADQGEYAIAIGTTGKKETTPSWEDAYWRVSHQGQVFSSASSSTSSDLNKKNSIATMDEKYLNLLEKLRPVTFKYNDGTSDRTHTGFIAQEVEKTLNDLSISTKDFAALINNDGNYYLRYEEFIPLNTLAIQNLIKENKDLKARIERLENLISG